MKNITLNITLKCRKHARIKLPFMKLVMKETLIFMPIKQYVITMKTESKKLI